MFWASAGMGAVLSLQDDLFSVSPSFAQLSQWADQPVWACIVTVCAIIRVLALIVNGTFAGFRYSPHIRAGASLVSMLFWSQFCLGFLIAAVSGEGAWTAVPAYSTFVLAELANLFRSGSDIGRLTHK
ncbi:hypothetical protein [Loktanella sp. R86503]|uniref:hypothetical protein n=1 Tax=Loktanella sp. R86503 TaxID=3093847 RepID=UPI0036D91E52